MGQAHTTWIQPEAVRKSTDLADGLTRIFEESKAGVLLSGRDICPSCGSRSEKHGDILGWYSQCRVAPNRSVNFPNRCSRGPRSAGRARASVGRGARSAPRAVDFPTNLYLSHTACEAYDVRYAAYSYFDRTVYIARIRAGLSQNCSFVVSRCTLCDSLEKSGEPSAPVSAQSEA